MGKGADVPSGLTATVAAGFGKDWEEQEEPVDSRFVVADQVSTSLAGDRDRERRSVKCEGMLDGRGHPRASWD